MLPGADPEKLAMMAALQRLEARIAALEAVPNGEEVQRTDFAPRPGQLITVEAPPTGVTALLPKPRTQIRSARITISARNANPVRWQAVDGTVNGAALVTSTAVGLVEAVCDGAAWHVSQGAASTTGSASAAEVLLGAASGAFPNGRVATDSIEIDVDLSIANVATWALRDGSVDVARLEDQAAGVFCAQLFDETAPPRFWGGAFVAGSGLDWTAKLANGPSPTTVAIDPAVRDQLFTNSSATSIDVVLPTNRLTQHRLQITILGTASVGGVSPLATPAGWTRVSENGSTISGLVIERVLDGSETSPLTITSSLAATHIAHLELIADSSGTLPSQASTRVTTASATNDPAPISPTTGVARYLSLQYGLHSDQTTIADPAGFPSGYGGRGQAALGGGGLTDGTLGYASLEAVAASGFYDPATWTFGAAGTVLVFNVAVPPKATYAVDVTAASAQIANSLSANLFSYANPNRNTSWANFLDPSLVYANAISNGPFPVATVRPCLTSEVRGLSHTFALPPEALVPDLPTRVLLWLGTCGLSTIATPAGWTLISTVATTGSRQSAFFLDVAAGASPSNPIAVTVGTATRVFAQFKTLVDYDPSTPPEAITATVAAAATSIDLTSMAPSWSTALPANTDYTLTAIFINETTGLVSAYPAGYTGGTQTLITGAAGVDDGGFAICQRQVRSTTEDPGAITWSGASEAGGMLVAVAPASCGRLSTAPDKRQPQPDPDTPEDPQSLFIPRPGWAAALSSNPRSGGSNAFVDVGQFINFGLDGPTTSNPQIRSGDATFRIRGGGNTFVFADGAGSTAALVATDATGIVNVQAQGSGQANLQSVSGPTQVSAGTTLQFATGGVPRVFIAASGEWTTPAGALGNVLTHQGAGTPPLWVAPAAPARDPLLALLPLLAVNDDRVDEPAFSPLPGWAAALASNPNGGLSSPTLDGGASTGSGGRYRLRSTAAGAGFEIGMAGSGVEMIGTLASIDSTATSFTWTATGSGFVATHAASNTFSIVGAGATGGFLDIFESATSAPSMSAAHGLFWVRNNAPNEAWYTDDTNVDRPLQNAVAGANVNNTVTALTTNLAICTAYSVPASTLVAGSCYMCVGTFTFTRGATATPLNVLVNFRVGGASITATLTGLTTVNAAVETFWAEAFFTVLTTGAGGTCSAVLMVYGAGTAGAIPLSAGVANVALACDTTAANAINIDAGMSAPVAGTVLTSTGGFVTPIR